jgi:putative transposase
MSTPRYSWRQLTPKQREEVLAWRKENARPWHSPPHRPNYGHMHFLVSAACYEHVHHIGFSPQRMDGFSATLLEVFQQHAARTVAWCVLPNHYHALVEAPNILKLLHELGRLHGRTSHTWNGEETSRGRQVFHRGTERFMRSERHFFATINYVHNNPVHHGYVRLWTEWPWSSAAEYLEQMGRAEAERVWKEYPIRDYGKKWDDAGI